MEAAALWGGGLLSSDSLIRDKKQGDGYVLLTTKKVKILWLLSECNDIFNTFAVNMLFFYIYKAMWKRMMTLLLAVLLAVGVAEAQRPKVGLVLGGGGAKGAAEVGVLKVIEEMGIQVDYIAGTSIGAIVGGLYATGYKAAELEELFKTQEWFSLLTDRREEYATVPYKDDGDMVYVFGFPMLDKKEGFIGGRGLLRGHQVEVMLDSLMGSRGVNEMERLRVPFRCVAFDMKTATEVVFAEGSPAVAMRASMAIPGCFKPVRIDDMTLVDGGMINNLPVDVVRAMGADIVIAIDLQQAQHKAKKPREGEGLLEHVGDLLALSPMVEWAVNRPDRQRYEENKQLCDIYIHPDIPDDDTMSFRKKSIERMMLIGEETARKHTQELATLAGLRQ